MGTQLREQHRTDDRDLELLHELTKARKRLTDQIARRIIGQVDVVDNLVAAILAGGHVLLVGVPGVAKTLLIQTLSQALDLSFNRVQFTPDLMPADITGTELLEEDHATGRRVFKYVKGPVFANVVLADEINRAPPKTQAALLQAMQEHTVTAAGQTHALPEPFFVLATQNPLEQAGTYPLPEAQLDRFLLHVKVGYPGEDEEREILRSTTGAPQPSVPAVMDGAAIRALQALARQVHVSEDLLRWINRLVRASRPGAGAPAEVQAWVRWGAGPRAGQALVLCAKARALLHGRLAATREDIAALAAPVLRHRLLLSFAAEAEGRDADEVVAALLRALPAPCA